MFKIEVEDNAHRPHFKNLTINSHKHLGLLWKSISKCFLTISVFIYACSSFLCYIKMLFMRKTWWNCAFVFERSMENEHYCLCSQSSELDIGAHLCYKGWFTKPFFKKMAWWFWKQKITRATYRLRRCYSPNIPTHGKRAPQSPRCNLGDSCASYRTVYLQER